jgi:hypothetical protein
MKIPAPTSVQIGGKTLKIKQVPVVYQFEVR